MAKAKSTKRFEQRHLKDTLKRRKDFAKVKQRHQLNAKRKARRAEENGGLAEAGSDDRPDDDDTRPRKKRKEDGGALNDMSVDDFFAGGFEALPKPTPSSLKKKKSKSHEAEDMSVSGDSSGDDQDNAFAESDAENSDEPSDDDRALEDIHKNDLKSLEKDDPEFYRYLKENDADLLNEFANLAEVDELSDNDDEAQPKDSLKNSKGSNTEDSASSGILVNKEMIKGWSDTMKSQHSLRAMREVVLAFRWIVHSNEVRRMEYKYRVTDTSVHHMVVLAALRLVPEVLNHHLPLKQLSNGKIKPQFKTDSKKYRGLTNLIKSHVLSMQRFLLNQSEETFLNSALSAMKSILPYALSFKKVIRDMTKAVVETWANSAISGSTEENAFAVIRHLVVIGDPSIQQDALRTAYQGLITGSRNPTVHNMARLESARNALAELWGQADPNVSYTTAFTFVRQLAIHLRKSIKNNANDSYKTVYNWQYVKSLDFWSVVLSINCATLREATNAKESPLRPLIYPLTQVTLGAMRLIPTAAYFPLRFHLIESLLRLSLHTNTFIPLATPLYEVLTSKEMKKPPTPSTLKPVDFETNIRVSKSYLRTRVYQDGVGEEVARLLADFFALWCKSIAFPELALPVIVMLKRWLKEVSPYTPPRSADSSRKHGKKGKNKGGGADTGVGGNRNNKVNSMVSLLVQKLEANAKFIEERRAKVDFAPNDRAGVESFLKEVPKEQTPLGAFVVGQAEQRRERKRVVEEGRKEEEEKRRREKEEIERERQMGGFSGSDDEESAEEEGEEELEEEPEFEMEDEMEEDDLEEDDLEDSED